MAKLTRTQKYATLRENLANDSEPSLSTKDLSTYQNRLDDIKGLLGYACSYRDIPILTRVEAIELAAENIIKDLAEKYNFSLDEIDYFILHQANARIIEATAKKLGVSRDKFPMNIMNYGNISSASIPILLWEMKKDGRLKPGMKLVLASFGAGLTWDANYIVY